MYLPQFFVRLSKHINVLIPSFHFIRVNCALIVENRVFSCELLYSAENVKLNTAGESRIKLHNKVFKCVNLFD